MARKYAIVVNNIVTEILTLQEEEVSMVAALNTIIDIEDQLPQPALGWVMNGNKLEIPQGESSREQFEIELAERKTEFGIKLAKFAINRIGARNKILNKSGAQVTALLSQLVNVKLLLETGALGTARYMCSQLKVVYTEYVDIFDLVIYEIDTFETNFGL